jgi:hypothetical protein
MILAYPHLLVFGWTTVISLSKGLLSSISVIHNQLCSENIKWKTLKNKNSQVFKLLLLYYSILLSVTVNLFLCVCMIKPYNRHEYIYIYRNKQYTEFSIIHGFRHPLGSWKVSPWIRQNYYTVLCG